MDKRIRYDRNKVESVCRQSYTFYRVRSQGFVSDLPLVSDLPEVQRHFYVCQAEAVLQVYTQLTGESVQDVLSRWNN